MAKLDNILARYGGDFVANRLIVATPNGNVSAGQYSETGEFILSADGEALHTAIQAPEPEPEPVPKKVKRPPAGLVSDPGSHVPAPKP